MPNDPEDKKRILARVRRIRGQCEALERALETGTACGPLLQQIAATRGAMNGLMAEVLEAHIRDEFGAPEGEGGAKTAELLALVRSYLK
ncbi:metal/formaldehyde-sensitive transcriptional repressor [Rhodobacter maris]|uniref:DNA-binding FrmR family transcriptional regulator n=1 Tax=Rhodobacter maris TaxID=446682 RepID=A0A285S0N4_9RHOB|nr:metal/formaldehyde-sensitive transcriptional repressor [Rhodobacter maris]SOB99926.1 DNA-binding FrmR family transcriptional regulator [Rhodobacter maris]